MFQAYRCRLCGDVYMGASTPSHCPYCGAHAKYLVPAQNWSAPSSRDLTDISRANLEGALKLEVDNTSYYAAEAGQVKDQVWVGIFKYLARVEGEHASTLRKTLGLPSAPAAPAQTPTADLRAALAEVKRRESRAGDFYQKASAEAKEGRVQEIFRCLIEIEADHLALAEETFADKETGRQGDKETGR